MENISSDLFCAVRKKAVGYTAEECVEEYGVNDGQLTLCKRKITLKEVPPDLGAVKMLMEMDGLDPYEKMSEEKLTNEQMFEDLMIDFDEMGFSPITLTSNPEEYAINWRNQIVELFNRLKEENRISNQHLKLGRKQYAEIQAKYEALQMDKEQLESDNCNLNMNLEHITKENAKLKDENESIKKINDMLRGDAEPLKIRKETAEKIFVEVLDLEELKVIRDMGWETVYNTLYNEILELAKQFGVEIKE